MSRRNRSSYAGVMLTVPILLSLVSAMGCEPGPQKSFKVTDCAVVVSPTEGSGCTTALTAAVEGLQPGETLRIWPGTYNVGDLRLDLVATATKRATVTAADPSRRPLLRGWTYLRSPRYVTFSSLRFSATQPDKQALSVSCGVGWTVERSHIFGARQTGATGTMNIAGRQPGGPNPDDGTECRDEPRGFRVSNNFFTDPYTNPRLELDPDPAVRVTATFYHHIYASFEGSSSTGGEISRNTFVGHRNGGGIKLGDGKFHRLGPWNVRVLYNTFYDGQKGVILHDDVRNNTLTGNMMVRMRGPLGNGTQRIAVAVNNVSTLSNTMSHTYVSDAYYVWAPLHPGARLGVGVDNAMRSNPRFRNYALEPGTAEARRYGAFGSGDFG